MKADDIVFEAVDLGINSVADDGTEVPIVKGVNFKVPRGSVVALIGESGSGKTTISLSALGYCKPGLKFANGEARYHGRNLLQSSNGELQQIRGTKVSYVAQSAAAAFNPALTINEQVTETSVLSGQKTQLEANKRAEQLYRALELPNPGSVGKRFPHQVSGGQLQRLMAAMALCGEPDLLVLDEPTTALDVTTQIEVMKAFKKVIKDEGAAAIYVTHDLALVAQIADYIVVLYRGEIQEKGPTEVIINQPEHPYTKRLIAAAKPKPTEGRTAVPAPDQGASVPALAVENVTAGYGRVLNGLPAFTILRDINMTVSQGHAIGVIGESGCGKSTLARVVAGLLPAAKGDVRLDGTSLSPSFQGRSKQELRKIQFVFQMADTALNPKHRVGDILGRQLELYFGLRGNRKRNAVAKMLELVELSPTLADRYPGELSGGQKQRINLARSLAAEPEIMLCDEVTSALDSIVGSNIIELLKRLRHETGVSFVFISHDLSTVSSFADDILVLYGGRVAEIGPAEKVLSPPFHPYTKLLISSVPKMRVGWLEDTTETGEVRASFSAGVELTETGCPFFNRCPLALVGTCDRIEPPDLYSDDEKKHVIKCHRELEDLYR